jgi:imidazolonepropionase-like amidohydrolase
VRRSRRRIAPRVALVVVLVLVAALVWLWGAVAPPEPLAMPEQGVVLSDVTLVQPGEWHRPNRRVVVEGGTIGEIGPFRAEGAEDSPAGLYGLFALPGLIDMHVHFPPDTPLRQTELFAFLHLLHGVTSVRDAADPDGTSTAPARDGVREGRFPGPRVFACGPLVDGPEPVWPNTVSLREPAEAGPAIAEIARAGFDCVKVYDGLRPAVLEAVHVAADAHGLPVIGHVPRRVGFAEARLDDVQHLTGVATAVGDLRPFPRNLDGWRSFDEADARAIVEASLRFDMAHTPTLVSLERMAAMSDYAAVRASADAQLLPRFYRDVVWSPTEGLPFLRGREAGDYALMREALPHAMEMVGRLHRAGVRIHAGTDAQVPFVVPGIALHREIRLLAEAGLGAEAALAAATGVPGAWLDEGGGLGRLEVGAPADLALFREDPTRDLDALDTLAAVIADGRLYLRSDLEAQLARYREHFEGVLYDAVSTALVRRVMEDLFEDEEPPPTAPPAPSAPAG